MCVSTSFLTGRVARKQGQMAEMAAYQNQKAQERARLEAESAENASEAQEAKEQVAPESGDTTEMSLAKRRRGVSATFLNDALGA